jgi:hypothetical protein
LKYVPFARHLAASALVLLLAACGGDSGANGGTGGGLSPAAYAEGMCGAAADWMVALQGRNTQLGEDLTNASDDPEAIQDLTVEFLDGAVQDTETLIEDVSALSAPDVENGQAIHDGVLSAFTQARDLFVDARDQVAGLDTSDPTAFTQALTDLATTLSEAGNEIAASVQGLENPELDAAFSDTPACATVSG